MARLAQIGVASAPACPGCRNRLTGLPLDELAEGAGYQCPFCGQHMRIPQQVLQELIRQRDERLAEAAGSKGSFFQRLFRTIAALFGSGGSSG